MKEVFNKEVLESKIEELSAMQTTEPTQEFLEQEYERCKDPRYFYNTYWQVDGKAVTPLSQEEWDSRTEKLEQWLIMKPRHSFNHKYYPATPEESIKFVSPTRRRSRERE